MIVLNHGMIPGTVPPVWTGRTLICNNCKFTATLEAHDEGIEIVNRNRSDDDPVQIRMECPTCAEPIDLEFTPEELIK